MRPGIFVSRTREKLDRMCDQIGRTDELFRMPKRGGTLKVDSQSSDSMPA